MPHGCRHLRGFVKVLDRRRRKWLSAPGSLTAGVPKRIIDHVNLSRGAIAAGLVLLSAPLGADEVILRRGGKLTGVVVEQTAERVVIDVSVGRVAVPRERVERVVTGKSALQTWRERAAVLAGDDVRGWLSLAQWAEERDMRSQAREAFEHVLALDPTNAPANRALGRVDVDGHWMAEDEAWRARGFVKFDGRWVTPDERDVMMADRAQADAMRAAALEQEARTREAAARARQAEADAQRAEAEAAAASQAAYSGDGGIPYPYVFGGSGYCTVDSPYCVGPRPPGYGHGHGGGGYGGGGYGGRGGRGDGPGRPPEVQPVRPPPPPPAHVPGPGAARASKR